MLFGRCGVTTAIETTRLGRRYGRHWALRGCSLSLPSGRVIGLVGPNGAGKTTLLHLAVGLLAPSTGEVSVLGTPPRAPDTRSKVAFVAQDRSRAAVLRQHVKAQVADRLGDTIRNDVPPPPSAFDQLAYHRVRDRELIAQERRCVASLLGHRDAASAGSSAVIVVPGLNDDQLIICRAIDETVFIVYPPGPEAGEIAAQWLRLASTLERGPPGFLDQPQQPPQHFFVGGGPVCEVFPAPGVEDDVPHSG